MHLLTVLVVTSAALGRELTWPGDCEVTRVSDGWLEGPIQQMFLLSYFILTHECEVNINIISEKSGICNFTENWIKGKYSHTLTCMDETLTQSYTTQGADWRDIFVVKPLDSKNKTAIVVSENVRWVEGLLPIFMNLSITGEADVSLNCPNAGCLKCEQKLITKKDSKFFSFNVRPGSSFRGVEIITQSKENNALLISTDFNQSPWNHVYVFFSQTTLCVWVNGGLVVKKEDVMGKNTVHSFQVLGDGEMKWCESEVPLELYISWGIAGLLFLLLCLVVLRSVTCRRKSDTVKTPPVIFSASPQHQAQPLEVTNISSSVESTVKTPAANEPIYESAEDLHVAGMGERHDSINSIYMLGHETDETKVHPASRERVMTADICHWNNSASSY